MTYRCGWCGQPCNEYGGIINPEDYKDWTEEDWNNAEKVHGICCQHEDTI